MKEKKNIFSLINIIISSVIVVGLIILIAINVIDKDAKKVFNDTYKSIVEVRVTEGENVGYGSGVIISDDGKIITNAHVVTYDDNNMFDKIEIRLSYEDNYREVELVKCDENKDLALLKLNDVKVTSIKVGDDYTYGDKVYAIGNGNNYGISITEGIISNPKLTIELSNKEVVAIQCDLTISEGNSGGALLNHRGKLIGITTFRLKDSSNRVIEGISYSIPYYIVSEFLNN